MKSIEELLQEELKFLKRKVEEATLRLKNSPKGNIRVRKWGNVVEYYYWDNEKEQEERGYNGRYLRKDEEKTAKEIIQRDYDRQVKKRGDKLVKAMEKFLTVYAESSLQLLYKKTNPHRRKLITPVVIPDEDYIAQWLSIEYKGKSFAEENEIITERGERVRSKSEKIIADKLHMLGIPYRYECPVHLNGNVTVYPDFTILKMPEREEVYLEHFGMLDDAEYVENMIFKLNTYEKNQIYIGINLFLTHETGRYPINVRALDDMLRKLFC